MAEPTEKEVQKTSPAITTPDEPLAPITSTTYCKTTPRLIIRSPLTRDVPFLLHMFTNPLNHTYETIDKDLSLAVYDSRVREWHTKAESGKQAFLIVCLKPDAANENEQGTDTPIGFSGYHDIKESTDAATGKILRKGGTGMFIDAPDYTGKGYAVEALRAVLDFGFAVSEPGEVTELEQRKQKQNQVQEQVQGLNLDEIDIGTLLENTPFQGVMRKLGLADIGVHGIGGDEFEPHKGKKTVDWKISREEWCKRMH